MSETLKRGMFLLLLLHSLWVLEQRWNMPLASPHQFREAETAISVYWMVNGDDQDITHHSSDHETMGSWHSVGAAVEKTTRWIAYQTPVMGPPWRIPFEFPTFQWIVAGVVHVTKMRLDNGGRLCSWLFLVASLVPVWHLGQRHRVDPWVAAALFLGSPVYLYWGTCFLIETCSLFLCLMFLWMIQEGRWTFALIIGVLAAITKPTTFSGVLLLVPFLNPNYPASAVIVGVALCSAFGWTHLTDLLKAQNPLSATLVSSVPRQVTHDWGTVAQRFSTEPWKVLWASVEGLL